MLAAGPSGRIYYGVSVFTLLFAMPLAEPSAFPGPNSFHASHHATQLPRYQPYASPRAERTALTFPGHNQFTEGRGIDVAVFAVLILYPKKHGTSISELRDFGRYSKTLRGLYRCEYFGSGLILSDGRYSTYNSLRVVYKEQLRVTACKK
jgi:hypothetical protein